MRALRARLTYANVMSSIAVFVVMGGGAYAASTIPRNSVGAKQIKANAVNSVKVKDGSLLARDFKAGQLPRGARGPAGAAGAAGAKGDRGDPGDPMTPAVSGDVYTGQLAVVIPAAEGFAMAAGSYPRALPNTVAAPTIDYRAGAVPDANCPGIGTAAVAGILCVYAYLTSAVASVNESGMWAGVNRRYGFVLDVARSGVANSGIFVASWAYKVP